MLKKPLAEPITGGSPDSVLSSLYRKILLDLGIDLVCFNRLTDQYISSSGLARYAKETTSVRGNIKKELLYDKMSWKVFLKGLTFLKIVKFDISVKLYHQNKKVTEHTRSVELYKENTDD